MKYSNIQWTTHTFNPWEGCSIKSEGCRECYAMMRNRRFSAGANWGPGKPRRRTSASNWAQVLKWNKEAGDAELRHKLELGTNERQDEYVRPRVFCASLADWLDEEVAIAWLADLLDLIRKTPNLDWLLLTKRPENWSERIEAAQDWLFDRGDRNTAGWLSDWRKNYPPANIWIGTTAENQKRADERLDLVLAIPATVRFFSCEPMIGPISLAAAGYSARRIVESEGVGIDWVICGGESGPNARPFVVEWADDLRRQCAALNVSFFMKQMGSKPHVGNANALDWPEETVFEETSEKIEDLSGFAAASVRLKDRGHGGEITEFPEELQVREFPS